MAWYGHIWPDLDICGCQKFFFTNKSLNNKWLHSIRREIYKWLSYQTFLFAQHQLLPDNSSSCEMGIKARHHRTYCFLCSDCGKQKAGGGIVQTGWPVIASHCATDKHMQNENKLFTYIYICINVVSFIILNVY